MPAESLVGQMPRSASALARIGRGNSLALLLCLCSVLGHAESMCSDTAGSAATGSLTDSGGASGNYSNFENCQFLVQPGTSGDITLSFSAFSYESGYDFIRVYDGTSTSDPLLGSFTGTSTPADVTATSGAMLIVNSTDFSITRSGFSASWIVSGASSCASENVADTFNAVSYSGSTGSVSWATDWLEIGESDGPSAGKARVNSSNCTAGNCLRLGEPSSRSTWSDRGVERELDLTDATTVALTFNYYTGRSRGTQQVVLEVSADGGGSWAELSRYQINSTSFTATPESFDISAYASANTRIRFLSSGNNAVVGMYIDDLQIAYERDCSPTATAEWRFDELSWAGGADEVLDSTGNGLDGSAAGGANTIAAGQVCRGSAFDGVDDQVVVADLDDTLGGTATLSFWLLTTQLGDNTSWRAPGLTGVEQSGGVDDVFWGWLDASGHIGVGSGDDPSAVSSTVVSDGNWHHVALTRDHVSGEVQVFIDGALEDTETSRAGLIGNSFDSFGVIRDTGGTPEYLNAVVDEVVMFDSVLSAGDIADIYANQLAGNSWDGEPRTCPNIIATGMVISHDQSGIYCLTEPVTVSAVDAANTVVTTYGDEITLDTQSGRGSWTLQAGNGTLTDSIADDGRATYQFDSADAGQASFLLSYAQGSSPLDVDAYQTSATNVRDDDSEGLLSFAPSGYTITANALPNPPPASIADPVGTQVAATDFAIHVAAFGTTDTDPDCGIIETYQGSFALQFWMDHVDPGTGMRTVTINGADSGASEAAATSQNIAFVNGQAQLTARYKDAGSVRVQLKDDATYPHTLRGATNAFVVRPFELAITTVESLAGDANPGALTMGDAGFVPSGANFTVIAEARDADGDVTPNFGLESAPELISIFSDALIAPAGGRHGSTGGIIGGASLTRTGPGQFSSNTVLFDEVGIIQLGAQVRDGDYLGIGSVPGPLSGNVGRFYPAAIALTSGAANAACNSFVYQDQPALEMSYTLQARNALGALVENYDTALLGSGNVAAVVRSAENADSGVSLNARLSSGTATWQNGVLLEIDTAAVFSRVAVPDGPFDDLQLGVALNDPLDGLTMNAADQHVSSSGDCALVGTCDAVAVGSPLQVRYGRLAVLPGSGSELEDLDVPLAAQYFDGAGFRAHSADQCSAYALASASLSSYEDALSAGETSPIGPIATTALVQGEPDPAAPLLLSAPGSGNTGSVLLQLTVPAWLQYDWFGTGATHPSGRQSFGLFGGHDRIVFWSERLN